ncbi:MAG: hypothetical protein Q4B29_00180 [Candidatus Saccharibacteria bacterium]|nr:hypothetical protein [Candidatus Saccharibacteria bacterium]
MKKTILFGAAAAVATLGLAGFMPTSVSAATNYTYDSFVTSGGYGVKTEISDAIMNLNRDNATTTGAFSKLGETQKLSDGIDERVNVEINPSEMAHGELFEVSLALRNAANEYVSEYVVMAQKTAEGEVTVTGKDDTKIKITKDGVYTFKWEMFIKEKNTFVKFSVLDGETVLGTTGEDDLDALSTADTKNPIAEQEGVTVKYLWFCNIQVAEGVNVHFLNQEFSSDLGEDAPVATVAVTSEKKLEGKLTITEATETPVSADTEEALFAYDIKYTVGGKETEITAEDGHEFKFTIALPEAMQGKDNYYLTLLEDGELTDEKIAGVVSQDGKSVTFVLNHFSTWVLSAATIVEDATPLAPKTGSATVATNAVATTTLTATLAAVVAMIGIAVFAKKH